MISAVASPHCGGGAPRGSARRAAAAAPRASSSALRGLSAAPAARRQPCGVRLAAATALSAAAAAVRPSNPAGRRRPVAAVATRAAASPAANPAASPSPPPQFEPVERFDFLVIGSGIAGLSYALKVADHGSVAIVTKAEAGEGCTRYAQGGVCAVLDPLDSPERHAADTRAAGAGLCDPLAVDAVCREGAARVLELVALGAEFTHEEESSSSDDEEEQQQQQHEDEQRPRGGDAAPTATRPPRLHLTREGGHSRRRVVHAADATGAEIERALLARARRHPNITFFEHHLAVDLVVGSSAATAPGNGNGHGNGNGNGNNNSSGLAGRPHCLGADVLDLSPYADGLPAAHDDSAAAAPPSPPRPRLRRFLAAATMLASGGAGQAYPNTTNPSVATGDGVAMAFRAGAAVSNMEFVQFHPTALYVPPASAASSSSSSSSPADDDGEEGAAAAAAAAQQQHSPQRTFLISEAVRGEGGRLFDSRGDRFMRRFDGHGDPEGMSGPMELSPRDVVARAIHAVMRETAQPHVWLDISHLPREAVLRHFPTIARACRDRLGLDLARDPIPVVPAQHYMVGGVAAGLRGETTVQGLFACGEVACSGLHGANRLASNSLLEGLVFADRAAGPAAAHAEYSRRYCSGAMDDAEREARARFAEVVAVEGDDDCAFAAHAALAATTTPAAPPAAAAAHLLAPPLRSDVARRAADLRANLRDELWRAAGIVRRTAPLERARDLARRVAAETRALRREHGPGARGELVELENLAAVSELVATCAAGRRESRGAHYTLDWPETLPASRARPSLVARSPETGWAVPVVAAEPAAAAAAATSGGGSLGVVVGGAFSRRGASSGAVTARPAVSVAPSTRALDVSVRASPEDD
jgi:L-aspartate oxidase